MCLRRSAINQYTLALKFRIRFICFGGVLSTFLPAMATETKYFYSSSQISQVSNEIFIKIIKYFKNIFKKCM